MTYIAAPAIGVTVFDARAFPEANRRIFRVTVGVIAMAAAWAIAACLAFAVTWMVAASFTANSSGRDDLALAPAPVASAASVRAGHDNQRTTAADASESARVVIDRVFHDLFVDPDLDERRARAVARAADVALFAPQPLDPNNIRPAPRPVQPDAAPVPVAQPAARPAIATRPPGAAARARAHSEEARTEPVTPAVDSRTAIYDIAARTVYMPNGAKLEAHSGLGNLIDNPRHVNVKNRGSTPPNVYNLTLREQLFHGVRALRLTPADNGKMFGRDGILAHSYMLGPNGQSNGCVSFSNYPAFLRAYLNGEVDRLVVVARLATPPAPAVAGRSASDRYASARAGTSAR